jgi:hypothetical protein
MSRDCVDARFRSTNNDATTICHNFPKAHSDTNFPLIPFTFLYFIDRLERFDRIREWLRATRAASD